MKYLYSLFIACVITAGLNAQCEVPNGGFEEWSDLSSQLNAQYGTTIPDGSVLHPTDWVPLSALLNIAFNVINVPDVVANTDVERLNEELLASNRTEDAKRGDYALKLGGSTTQSDIIYTSVSACVPVNATQFSYRLKHERGTSPDSLLVLIFMGESADAMLQAENQFDDAVGKYVFDYISNDADLSYISRRIDIETNNKDLSLDSMVIQVGVFRGDAEEESFFVIDDFNFLGTVSTKEQVSTINFSLNQNVSGDKVFPQLDLNSYNFNKAEILDINGRIIESYSAWKEVVDISGLQSGSYFLVVHCDEGVKAESFVKF